MSMPSQHLHKAAIRGIKRRGKSGSPSGNGPETRATAGDRTACKAVYIGSIPVRASKRIKYLSSLRGFFCARSEWQSGFATPVLRGINLYVHGAIGRGRETALPTKRPGVESWEGNVRRKGVLPRPL